MAVRPDVVEKSRLGRVLVGRNLITEEQLDQALAEHYQSGERLGEIAVGHGWISERDLHRALKQQRRTRYAAAVVAMVVTPIQPMWALAAGAGSPALLPKTPPGQMLKQGFQPLDDAEMASVGGQGFEDDYESLYAVVNAYDQRDPRTGKLLSSDDEEAEGLDGLDVLGLMGQVFYPLSNVLDAQVELVGVEYDPSRLKPLLAEDGQGFNVNLPSRIERLSFIDIRPAGSQGATMGSVHFEGIRFHENTSIVVRPY